MEKNTNLFDDEEDEYIPDGVGMPQETPSVTSQ